MNQPGHSDITRAATVKLLASHDDKLLGLHEWQLFPALNEGQAYADRLSGDTAHRAVMDPDAQRHHSMADPNKSGSENLHNIQDFITSNLEAGQIAHLHGDSAAEFRYLGAAVHALEDSYSAGHAFRDPAQASDPHASIQALNVYYTSIPVLQGLAYQTHSSELDKVPTDLAGHFINPVHQAAVDGVVELVRSYARHVSDQPGTSSKAFRETVVSLIHGDNVHVLGDPDSHEYKAHVEAYHNNDIHHHHSILDLLYSKEDRGGATHVGVNPGQVPDHVDPAGANLTDEHGNAVHVDAYDGGHAGQVPDHVDPAGANLTDEHGNAVHVDAYDGGHAGQVPDHVDPAGIVDTHGDGHL